MKWYAFWLAVTAAALVAAIVAYMSFVALAEGHGDLLRSGADLKPWAIFSEASIASQSIMLACVALVVWAGAITWLGARELRRGKPKTEAEIVLRFLAPTAVLIGLAGAAQIEGMVQTASAATGITKAMVLAPYRAEEMMSIILGVFAALSAVAGAAFLYSRRKSTVVP